MRRLCICMLIAALLLGLSACELNIPDILGKFVTEPVETQTGPEAPADELSQFRGELGTHIMAVADFGFPLITEEAGIMGHLLEEYPGWMGEHGFIGQIPRERTVRYGDMDGWVNLLCIVPADPAATVCVNVVRGSQTEVIYRSEQGEPILLLTEITEEFRLSVSVTDSSGQSAVFSPYWDYPEDEKIAKYVADFTPISEKSAYENALEFGWVVPEDSFRTDHLWHSDLGYDLELIYCPGQYYDGEAYIYEYDSEGAFVATYSGNWCYLNGLLTLHLKHCQDESLVIREDFPVLTDPDGNGWLGIARTEAGVGLPTFEEGWDFDELLPVSGDATGPYKNAVSQGWRIPELWELLDTEWRSFDYAMDLLDDSVPEDNCGKVIIYDVNENGAYTRSYTGSWRFEEGMLHLTLIPDRPEGIFVDDSFPVLMLDGALWIGRNENGFGLPHFYDDQLVDILEQPMG